MTRPVPLLEVNALQKHFPIKGGLLGGVTAKVYAVDGVSFTIDKGETLSLVGESGCGKSTVGRTILRLVEPTDGEVFLDGQPIHNLPASQLRPLRRRIQVVFQDPFSSLNPRMRVRDIIAEPLQNFGLAGTRSETDDRVAKIMDTVRLPRDAMNRFPHEFSGGQRQRIGIARALAPGADLIICDEAVSALDVSVKAQIVNLLSDLQDELGLALLFISHDLAIVEHLTHRVAVMYLGKIVEIADRRALLYDKPRSTPTPRALLSAIPIPDARARTDSRERTHRPARRRRPTRSILASRLSLPHPLPLRVRPLPQRGAAPARHGPGAEGRVPSRRAARTPGRARRRMTGRTRSDIPRGWGRTAGWLLLVIGLVLSSRTEAAPSPTLAAIRDRGSVVCGVQAENPPFSLPDSQGVWRGLDIDSCRALAAAILGDAAKITIRPITGLTRFRHPGR